MPAAIHCLGVGGLTCQQQAVPVRRQHWKTITGSGGSGGSTTVVGGDGITTIQSTATVAVDLASAANGLVIILVIKSRDRYNVLEWIDRHIKIGSGLSITSAGVLSATGGGGGFNPTAGRALTYDAGTIPDTLNGHCKCFCSWCCQCWQWLTVTAGGELSVDGRRILVPTLATPQQQTKALLPIHTVMTPPSHWRMAPTLVCFLLPLKKPSLTASKWR